MIYNTKLGLGPAIYIADGSTLHDPRLVRFLQETAEAEKIPYQFRQPGGGGTDSGAIQRSLAGHTDSFGFGPASLYTFSGQHLPRGRLEEYVEFAACRIEAYYSIFDCNTLSLSACYLSACMPLYFIR